MHAIILLIFHHCQFWYSKFKVGSCSISNIVRRNSNICCHNSNLLSKCGVKFICQQKSNICLFQQQTNLWQRFILASIYYYLQGKLFFSFLQFLKIYQQNIWPNLKDVCKVLKSHNTMILVQYRNFDILIQKKSQQF